MTFWSRTIKIERFLQILEDFRACCRENIGTFYNCAGCSVLSTWFKYLAEGAELELNVDYGTRHALSCSMRSIDHWLTNEAVSLEELSVLFDVAMHQMYQFCKASMLRFKRSDDFEALLRCFRIEPHREEMPNLVVKHAVSP